jgi:hypothetical protein
MSARSYEPHTIGQAPGFPLPNAQNIEKHVSSSRSGSQVHTTESRRKRRQADAHQRLNFRMRNLPSASRDAAQADAIELCGGRPAVMSAVRRCGKSRTFSNQNRGVQRDRYHCVPGCGSISKFREQNPHAHGSANLRRIIVERPLRGLAPACTNGSLDTKSRRIAAPD